MIETRPFVAGDGNPRKSGGENLPLRPPETGIHGCKRSTAALTAMSSMLISKLYQGFASPGFRPPLTQLRDQKIGSYATSRRRIYADLDRRSHHSGSVCQRRLHLERDWAALRVALHHCQSARPQRRVML
jgi:hypothetical protein